MKVQDLVQQFLKHIERCKSLLHLIDITNVNLIKAYNQVKNELQNYSEELIKKELIVLNKIDLVDRDLVEKIVQNFQKIKSVKCLLYQFWKKIQFLK